MLIIVLGGVNSLFF